MSVLYTNYGMNPGTEYEQADNKNQIDGTNVPKLTLKNASILLTVEQLS